MSGRRSRWCAQGASLLGLSWMFVACTSEPGNRPDDNLPPPNTASPCAKSTWPQGDSGWELICDSEATGHFLSVWGSARDDVYLAGGVPRVTGEGAKDGRTVIWRYDGIKLAAIQNPGLDRAWWVFGPDADHVYVVGERGLGLRRIDGGAFEPFDTGTTQTIFGIWGRTPNRLYFVSGDFQSPTGRGQLHVLTPAGPSVVDDPVFRDYEGKALFKVWGSSDSDVYVSGELGAIFHFDGLAWSRLDTPDERTPILTVAGTSTDTVYAVGGRGRGALWRRQSGGAFEAIVDAGVELPGLMGVFARDDYPVLISGENGFLGTVVGGAVSSEGGYTYESLHAVWRDEEGTAWAVGGNFNFVVDEALGVVLRRPAPKCSSGQMRSPGYHHLDLQGRSGTPKDDGSYPMYDVNRGYIHPELVHGEHYLLGPGSFVEFTIPLCNDITDEVAFRLPNNDEPGAVARHQLFVVKNGREILVAEATDSVPGNMGYIPFNRSSLDPKHQTDVARTNTSPRGQELGWGEFADAPAFETPPRDILAGPGDSLLFRTTNLSEKMYGLMVWFPQNGLEYQAFLEVRVPEVPGGIPGDPILPPPEPGQCTPSSSTQFVELGRGERDFIAFPPNEAPVVTGPQGSLMFIVAVRGTGFEPGNELDLSSPENPRLIIRLATDNYASMGGRIVADGSWRRGFRAAGAGVNVLTDVRPTVPVGAATIEQLRAGPIYAETIVVDARSNRTLCQNQTFEIMP